MSAPRLIALFAILISVGLAIELSSGRALSQDTQRQEIDVSRLAHPEVAERLSLDDAQRVKIQQLLLQRGQALASAADAAQRKELEEQFQQDILELLTPEQQTQFTTVAPTQKLMFQFREMKWEDVLKWFAEQQDLTLVMDRTPGGTFTYADTRAYSPSEGIDLLNSVLMTRGFTLVRREKMLVVMELNDSIPLELLPRVPIENLDERGRFEIVSVLFPLAGRPVDAVLQEVKPYLSGYGRAIPLARGGQLLVVETAGKMQTINELIASVPIPQKPAKEEKPAPPPKPVFAAYPLGELDPTATLETIRKLIPSEQITVDSKTSLLSAYVIPDQQAAIQSAIEKMIASHADLAATESVAYRVTRAKPDELRQQIIGLAPQAIVSTSSDRLLVIATAEDQRLIGTALKALGIEPLAADKSLKVFEVLPSSAESVATALRTFLPGSYVASNPQVGSVLVRGSADDLQLASDIIDIWRQSQQTSDQQLRAFALDRTADADWLATVQKIVPDAKVWLSAVRLGQPGQQLMLLGRKQDIAAMEASLQQLLTVLPEPDQRELRIYRMSANQQARRATLSQLPAALADVKLVDGQSSEELLVWADAEQHTVFEQLLEQLDQPLTTLPTLPKSYPLDVQDVATVKQLLTAEFPGSQLIVNAAGDELTVLATADVQIRIAERVAEFNASLPARAEPVLESYAVQGMTAASLQQTLAPLLLGAAQATIDTEGQRLLVRADAETHEKLREMTQALSVQPDVRQQKVVIAYPLSHATATNVKLLLDQILRDATVLADDKLRQLVVTGSLDAQATAKAALDQIDRLGGAQATPQIRSYDAGRLQATALLPTLQAMWPRMQLSVDATTNQVVASGTDQEQLELQGALEQLTGASAGEGQQMQAYAVPFGEMWSLPAILKQLAPRALISSDAVSRTVTVWGGADEQARVRQALEALQKTAEAAKEPVVYQVKPARALAAQTSLRVLFPSVGIAADPTTGQLFVVAPQEIHERIAALVKEFDQARQGTQTRVLPVKKASARSLQFAINEFATEAEVTVDTATNSLIITATDEELEHIAKIVEQVDGATREGMHTQVLPVSKASVRSLQLAINEFAAEAEVTVDTATNSLIVTATDQELEQITKIVEQVDSGGEQSRSTQFYPVLGSEPQPLSRALEGSFPRATFAADSSSGGLFATATDEEHAALRQVIDSLNEQPTRLPTLKSFVLKYASPEMVAQAIENALGRRTYAGVSFHRETKSVFVVGSRDDLLVAETLVKQIDIPQGANDSRKLRAFSLAGADGRSVSQSIETLFEESADAVDVHYDSLGEQLIVVGQPAQLELVAETIEQLASPPRQLEIVQFQATDPYSFKLAADTLYEDEPYRTAPSINVDPDQQRVIIRATMPQLEELRQLLRQMGEVPPMDMRDGSHGGGVGSGTGFSGGMIGGINGARLRIVPVHRNSEKLLEDLRRLWPAARGNPLEIIRPTDSPADDTTAPATTPEAKPDQPRAAGQSEDNAPRETQGPREDISQSSAVELARQPRLVATTVNPTSQQGAVTGEPAPIVIVVGQQQWTLASADTQALDQFQRLLNALLSPRLEPFTTTGNYSVYLLKSAGADQIQELLSELFRPERGRSSSFTDLMQRVKIVADSRINALIVSGSRLDRSTVEQLLGVLDSEDLLDSLQQITPSMITLRSASAENVEDILRDVYRAQLSSGAGRRPAPIPEGVSSEIALVLQQINAQASGPLLTIAIDDTSNSIVLRAPRELTSEIRTFVESLDQQAQEAPAKRVELIQLQSTNTKNLQQALRILLSK